MNETSSAIIGYSWQEFPVYNDLVDGETKYGNSVGVPRRSRIGGPQYDSSKCGSRCVACNNFSANAHSDISARGCNKRVLS